MIGVSPKEIRRADLPLTTQIRRPNGEGAAVELAESLRGAVDLCTKVYSTPQGFGELNRCTLSIGAADLSCERQVGAADLFRRDSNHQDQASCGATAQPPIA